MPKIGVPTLTPYWQTNDGSTVRLYQGHAPAVLRRLPAGIVQTVVTSPPYWGLRDYGTGDWEGGKPDCDHKAPPTGGLVKGSTLVGTSNRGGFSGDGQYKDLCGKCGAKRIDLQLGSEPSPDCLTQGKAQCGACFVCNMVGVFREVRRVLRDDGTVWLNLGDSYVSSPPGNKVSTNLTVFGGNRPENARMRDDNSRAIGDKAKLSGLKNGNLVGVPWRVALALQADGWILRQDIVWAKPSPMPESVRNRCTKAHEYIFLLAKRMGYYYDCEAIREKTGSEMSPEEYEALIAANSEEGNTDWYQRDTNGVADGSKSGNPIRGKSHPNGRNKRSVWTVSSQGYPGAHFATFPPRLIEPCIKAGTSEKGCCEKCGAPWKRLVEERALTRERPNDYVKRTGEEGTGNSCPNSVAGVETRTVGWEAGCKCGASVVPCRVLDPFFGAGTTGVVCLDLGVSCVGIDLSEKYLRENAIPRIEGVCLARPALVGLVRRERQRVVIGKKV